MTQGDFFEAYEQVAPIEDFEELTSDEFDRWDLEYLPGYVLMDGCLFKRKEKK